MNSGRYNSPLLRKSSSSSFPEVLLGIALGESSGFLSMCHDSYSCVPKAFASRELPMRKGVITNRNIHFYDENFNDKSKIVIKNNFLWRKFWFHHRSPWRTSNPPYLWWNRVSSQKNVTEQHNISSQIIRATVPARLWRSYSEVWRTGLHHWINYWYVMNNIWSITTVLHHRSPHGIFSIRRVPMGPTVTHPWRL